MPLDSIDNITGFGCPDFGPNHLVVNSVPYELESFRSDGPPYQSITLLGDSREFIGDTYYLTPHPSKARLLLEASSINFRGQLFKAISPKK